MPDSSTNSTNLGSLFFSAQSFDECVLDAVFPVWDPTIAVRFGFIGFFEAMDGTSISVCPTDWIGSAVKLASDSVPRSTETKRIEQLEGSLMYFSYYYLSTLNIRTLMNTVLTFWFRQSQNI